MSNARRIVLMVLLTGGLGVLLSQALTEQAMTLAATAAPVALSSGPTRVALDAAGSRDRGALESLIASLGDRRIALILRGVRAVKQPGVVYQLYLDLPPASPPDADTPHFAGTFNFFNAVLPPDAEAAATADGLFDSFDVTEIAKRLHALGRLTEPTTVTIVPVGAPAHDARPTIARIELVAHQASPDRRSLLHD